MIDPRHHGCDVPDLSYSMVKLGLIVCRVCGRSWTLKPWGWQMEPLVKERPL